MYDREIIKKALQLNKEGKNNSEIARELGVPRTTIKDWIKRNKLEGQVYKDKETLEKLYKNMINNSKYYSYILGLYLGDGHISKMKRTYRFRIFQDIKYTKEMDKCILYLGKLFPENSACVGDWHTKKCKVIILYNNFLDKIFPQHGPGKKHTRKIELVPWQKEIVEKFPEEFLCGLIDSDGCRFISQGYLHYQFTNKSEDIKDLFCWTCEMLDINFTRKMGYKNIFIYKKESVEKIENIYNNL